MLYIYIYTAQQCVGSCKGVTNDLYQIARDAWHFELATLLDVEDDDFMLQIANNTSLHEFMAAVLDSQLNNATLDPEISRLVFLVYVRAGRLECGRGPLFTPDQLSSFAVIYGESNRSNVQTLFSQFSATNPSLVNAFNETIAVLTACVESAGRLSPDKLERLYVVARLLEALTSAVGSADELILDAVQKCYNGSLAKADKGATLYRIKHALIATWDHIIGALYFEPLESGSKDADELMEAFYEKLLNWISDSNVEQPRHCLVDAPLIMDWIVTCSIVDKIDGINKKVFNGDEGRLELKLWIEQIRDMAIVDTKTTVKGRGKKEQPSIVTQPVDIPSQDAAANIDEVANISQIHDLFPDLGEGFVRACLAHNNNDVEVVIMQLLDNNLPPALDKLDRTLKDVPSPEPAVTEAKKPSILDSRRNIFDNDEFDLLSRQNITIDKSKMHKGARDRGTADTMLDDKSFIQSEKENVLKRIYDMYEDEYDDQYDAFNEVSGPVDLSAVENEEAADVVMKKNKSTDNVEAEGDLIHAYVEHRDWFNRTSRKSKERHVLEQKTGMSAEQIEGWAIMMDRNPRRQRVLDKYMLFDGTQGAVEAKTDKKGKGPQQQQQQQQQQKSGPEKEQRQRAYKDKNKARFGNHNRKKGHDKKMVKAGVAGPSS
ncbi:hypothetical protein BJV82DRAFT_608644 [Fennellomyces sp. T-0311]|nr:hypothetical protein BJV82DRAFT_608644 [Fennellomyces sp. T-0311]